MKKHKKNLQDNGKFILFAMGVVQIIFIGWVICLQYSVSVFNNSYDKSLQQLRVEQANLNFCVEQQIRPCNISTINEWNEQHPDNQFHHLTF